MQRDHREGVEAPSGPGGDPAGRDADRRAWREAEAAVERLGRLQAVTAALSGARTPDEVADVALYAGVAVLGAARGAFFVVTAGVLEVLRCAGVSEALARAAASRAGNPAADALRTVSSVFVPDHATLVERYPALRDAPEWYDGEALAALPLGSAGRCVGVLLLEFDEPRTFGAEDGAFAAAMSELCTQALDRAGLYAAERAARADAVAAQRRLAFLDELSAHLAETLDEGEMLSGVARLAVPTLGDWAGLYTREGDALALALAAERGDPTLFAAADAAARSDPERRLARAAEGGAPAVLAVGLGAHAAVAPLSVHGLSLGALAVASVEGGRAYGASDLALLADIARRTALAIGHARLLRDAKLAAQAREEFLHVASHELRAPIATLRLNVQMLSRDARKGLGVAQSRLQNFERQVDRLTRFGDMLLDVSRITTGRLELAREAGDLAALAREVVARNADAAEEAGSTLTVDAPGPVPCVIDAPRMDQVLTNLLSNALKYGRGAPVRVSARVEGRDAIVEVQDGGIGIAPDDLQRIFDRFERAVSTRQFGGLGLGLWIARQIVEAHGGTIRVVSAPEVGSTFTVVLPAA